MPAGLESTNDHSPPQFAAPWHCSACRCRGVRIKHEHSVCLCVGGSDHELVDDDLRGVGEVAELSTSVGISRRITNGIAND